MQWLSVMIAKVSKRNDERAGVIIGQQVERATQTDNVTFNSFIRSLYVNCYPFELLASLYR